LNILFDNRYMFRSYDHLQAEIENVGALTRQAVKAHGDAGPSRLPHFQFFYFLNFYFYCLKVGCLHPVACTRSGSGFPSNATLF
jgi:hypothetical protein